MAAPCEIEFLSAKFDRPFHADIVYGLFDVFVGYARTGDRDCRYGQNQCKDCTSHDGMCQVSVQR